MSFLVFIGRLISQTIVTQLGPDIYTRVARYAIRQGTAAIVRHVRNQSRPKLGADVLTYK